MNVIALKNATFDIGAVGIAFFQAINGRFFIAEGLQERERETVCIKRLLR